MPKGIVPLTGSWLFKHGGLKNEAGEPLPERTCRSLVKKLREEPHRAPNGAHVMTLEVERSDGKREPISVLVSFDVFLSTPGQIPALVAAALAYEDGPSAAFPCVNWSRSTLERMDRDDLASLENQTSEPWLDNAICLGEAPAPNPLSYASPRLHDEAEVAVTERCGDGSGLPAGREASSMSQILATNGSSAYRTSIGGPAGELQFCGPDGTVRAFPHGPHH